MIICIGIAVLDVVFDTATPLLEGIKNQVLSRRIAVGGNGVNVAKVLKHYNNSVELVTVIGDDIFGGVLRDDLKKSEIKIIDSEHYNSIETPISFIINNTTNGLRTIVNHKEIPKFPKLQLSSTCEFIYSDGRFSEFTKQYRKAFPSVPILWDWERVDHFYDNVDLVQEKDIIIASEEFLNDFIEVNKLIEQSYIDFIFQKIDCNEFIITKGSKGVYWYSRDLPMTFIPSIKCDAIDTNGAGDVFHALFIHFYLQNKNIFESLQIVNTLCSEFVSKQGFVEALPVLTKENRNSI